MSGTLLVTGGAGYLGRRLLALAPATQALPGFPASWERVVATVHRAPLDADSAALAVALDLADGAAVAAALDDIRPAAIIHAAAVTPAARGPADDRRMWRVNVEGSAAVARWAAAHGARLVHVSSDAIWGGRDEPYREDDAPAPITPYGASKAAAEAVVAALHPAAAIARTSLIYGWAPPDPYTLMAEEMLGGVRGGCLFTDEFRCPVFVDDLARALLGLAGAPPASRSPAAGVLHLVGPSAVSRYELGAALIRRRGGDPAKLPGGSAAASGLRRPSRVVVDSSQTRSRIPWHLRGIHEITGQEAEHGANPGIDR